MVIDRDGMIRWINLATKACLLIAEPSVEQALRQERRPLRLMLQPRDVPGNSL
ncbi:MAG: hypothetical protein WBM40_02250 [Thiohalocapsa sp.]